MFLVGPTQGVDAVKVMSNVRGKPFWITRLSDLELWNEKCGGVKKRLSGTECVKIISQIEGAEVMLKVVG